MLVACECTCECGSQGNERVTCVHILPVAFQLTIFMVACLAENILLELSALWASETIEQSLSVKEAELMKKNVAKLIDAGSECNETPYETSGNISDMLRMFAVGTEKRKKTNVGIVPIDDLGPICFVKKESMIHKAAVTLQLLSGS